MQALEGDAEGQQSACNMKIGERILNSNRVRTEMGIERWGKKGIEQIMNKIKCNEIS